ncbi:hypothetical protein [Azohydromonas aeria]|uniref:hypothetical protein n=1 Tax=Azohydromonas aeria TaxID=2590212 RepID=UPI0012F9691C|nr:hypothetical protein [Azohydromonas aeria]
MNRWHRLPAAKRRLRGASAALALALAAAGGCLAQGVPADGTDATDDGPALSWSAFGTAGYAVSDRPWRYQRYIDDGGTFRRDSVLGAQLDLQLTPQWSATLQPRLAPASRSDKEWHLTAAWAFAAWRPGNDWLLRAGKLRVPFMLRSEQLDVGQTYDEARVPAEVYQLLPANDFTGAHVTRNWSLDAGELSLDLYRGSSPLQNRNRVWLREGIPGALPAGVRFNDLEITVQGAVLTWRGADLTARAGVHHTRVRSTEGSALMVRPSWAELAPGVGYWQTSNGLPGPGVTEVGASNNLALTVGGEARLGGNWRMAAELLHVVPRELKAGLAFTSGYVTAYRSWSALTAYASVAAIRAAHGPRDWVRRLESTTVPATVPGAALLNASMRARADTIPLIDQRSLALGASYALTPHSRLKAEWLHVRAHGSQFIDTPAGEPLLRPRGVNVLSMSYSFAF